MSCVKNNIKLKDYPRFVTTDFVPFDVLNLAYKTEKIVSQGRKRKYTQFYTVGVYGGIATGYTCGCCLRCVFCWVGWSRDFPEKYGEFYSPEEVVKKLENAARPRRIKRARISGGEPTLAREHLLQVLQLVEHSSFELFILETNGILFGADESLAREIARFKKVHTRVSLKAGTPQDFTRKTGARPEDFALPFAGIGSLASALGGPGKPGARFHIAAMSADPRFMDEAEREELLKLLERIHPKLSQNLEEEVVDPYPTAVARLKYAGYDLKWR
jgi:uncharacterized Fe-S cluster-containing radical SAM superfamily protein